MTLWILSHHGVFRRRAVGSASSTVRRCPPPWLWKLRLALSVIVFAFVMLYAITGERRCSSEDTNT